MFAVGLVCLIFLFCGMKEGRPDFLLVYIVVKIIAIILKVRSIYVRPPRVETEGCRTCP